METRIPEGKKLISPTDKMSYMGRIDFDDPNAPVFIWAGSNVRMRFKGTSVSAVIFNRRFFNKMSVGYVIDGKVCRADFGEENEREKSTVLRLQMVLKTVNTR